MMDYKMIRTLIFFILIPVLFISCGKNHEKIVKKMLEKRNETECCSILSKIQEELNKEQYYKWNGKQCVLKVEGGLEVAIDRLIAFHKENHNFIDKQGNFDQKEWDNWMYFFINPSENEKSASLRTDCFICLEKLVNGSYEEFETNAFNSKEELVYSSHFGDSVKQFENTITEKYKEKQKIAWMGKCNIQLLDYIYGYTKTVNQIFSGMPERTTIEKETDGNNFIVKAYISVNDEKIISLESLFQCVKATGTCYCMETTFTFNGQTTRGKVHGSVYSDPEGAGYCLQLLCSGAEILKVFQNK